MNPFTHFLVILTLLAGHAAFAQTAFLGIIPEKSVDVQVQGYNGTGLMLKQVVAKTPAADGGLKAGDVLILFDGKPVEDGDDLTFFLRKSNPGDRVTLEWVRGGARQKGAVKLGSREEPDVKIKVMGKEIASINLDDSAFLGIGSLSINDNLLKHFGVKDDHGILIDAVVKGSPAERAGVRVGDVLVELDGHAVESPGRLRRLLEDRKPGDKVRLRLVRDRQNLVVDVVLADRDRAELKLELELPELPELPELARITELPDWRGPGDFPGRAAIVSTLELIKRLAGTPLTLLEN
jgi:S1-C subfamily serine protease